MRLYLRTFGITKDNGNLFNDVFILFSIKNLSLTNFDFVLPDEKVANIKLEYILAYAHIFNEIKFVHFRKEKSIFASLKFKRLKWHLYKHRFISYFKKKEILDELYLWSQFDWLIETTKFDPRIPMEIKKLLQMKSSQSYLKKRIYDMHGNIMKSRILKKGL